MPGREIEGEAEAVLERPIEANAGAAGYNDRMTLEPGEDTDPRAAAVQLEILRKMSPPRKIQLVCQANRTNRELLRTGLRCRFPQASPHEIERRLRGLLLGEELARKVYGPLPDDAT